MMSSQSAVERRRAAGTLKTVFVGEKDVGKQSLLCRIIRGDQDLDRVASIEAETINPKGNLAFEIFPNQYNDSPLGTLFSAAQIILVVFDVSRRRTLEEAIDQLQSSANLKDLDEKAEMLLVGHILGGGPREVSSDEGAQVALKFGMAYIEVDAERTTQDELLSKLIQLGQKYKSAIGQAY